MIPGGVHRIGSMLSLAGAPLPPPRAGRLALFLTLLLFPVPALYAQGAGGSESGLVVAHAVDSAGGRALNGTLQVGGGLSQVSVGEVSTSESYIVRSGVVWMPPAIDGNNPLVFGPAPTTGDKDGGDTLKIFGFGFTKAGAGALDVTFAGSPGSGATVFSNTTATVDTPAGLNLHLNPLGLSDVGVSNNHGSATAVDGFHYLPSLSAVNNAQSGQRLKLRIIGDPSGFYAIGIGISLPGFSVPIFPFEGALELIFVPQDITGLQTLDTHGQATKKFKIKKSPSLIGSVMEFQALAINPALTGGAFTNLLPLTVLP